MTMLARFYDVVQDKKGNGISGATVTVERWNGDDATLYTTRAGTTTTSHVLTTDAKGQFSFYAPDGMYSITVEKAGVLEAVTRDDVYVGGGKYLNPEWFGIFEGADGTDITAGLQDWVYEILEHTTGTVASGVLRSGQIVLPHGSFVADSILWHPSISLAGSNRAGTVLTLKANATAIGPANVRALIYILARARSSDGPSAWMPVLEDIILAGNKANQSNLEAYGIYCENGNLDPDYATYAPDGDSSGYSAFHGRNIEVNSFSGTGINVRADRQRLMLNGRWRTTSHGILSGSTVVTVAEGLYVGGNDPVLTDGGAGACTGHAINGGACSGLIVHGCNIFAAKAAARSNNALALHAQNCNGITLVGNVFNDTVSLNGTTFDVRSMSIMGNDFRPGKGILTADGVTAGSADVTCNAFIRVRGYKNVVIGLNNYNSNSNGERFEYLATFTDDAAGYIEYASATSESPDLLKPWHTTNAVPIYAATGGTCTYKAIDPTTTSHRFSGTMAVGLGDAAALEAYTLHVGDGDSKFNGPVLFNRPARLIWAQTVATTTAVDAGTTVVPDKQVETILNNASVIATHTLELPTNPEDGARYAVISRGGVTGLTMTLSSAATTAGHNIIGSASRVLAAGGSFAMRFKESALEWWPSS